MANIEKKKQKLVDRIIQLDGEIVEALTKKTSSIKEIDVAAHMRKIADARLELSKLK